MNKINTDEEQIERWARYIKTHKEWRIEFNQFINSQFEKSERFYKKLAESHQGREKIRRLKELRMGKSVSK